MNTLVTILCVVVLVLAITAALIFGQRYKARGAKGGDVKKGIDFQKIFGGGEGVCGGGLKQLFALLAATSIAVAGNGIFPPETAKTAGQALAGGVEGLEGLSSDRNAWGANLDNGTLDWSQHTPVDNMLGDLVDSASEVVRANALVFAPATSLDIPQIFEDSSVEGRAFVAGPSTENVALALAASLRFDLSVAFASNAIDMAIRGNPMPGTGAASLMNGFTPKELRSFGGLWKNTLAPKLKKIGMVGVGPLRGLLPPPSPATLAPASGSSPGDLFPTITVAGAELGSALSEGLAASLWAAQSPEISTSLTTLVQNPVQAVLEIAIPQGMRTFDPVSGEGALSLVGSANSRIARSSYILSVDTSATPESRKRQIKGFIDYIGRLLLDGARRGEFSLAELDTRALTAHVGLLPMGRPEVLDALVRVAVSNGVPQYAAGMSVVAMLSSLPAYSGFPVWKTSLLGPGSVRLAALPSGAAVAMDNSFVSVQAGITAAGPQLGLLALPEAGKLLQLMSPYLKPQMASRGLLAASPPPIPPQPTLSPAQINFIKKSIGLLVIASGAYKAARARAPAPAPAPVVALPAYVLRQTVSPLSPGELAARAKRSGKPPLSFKAEDGSQVVLVAAERPTAGSPAGMYMVPVSGGTSSAETSLTLLAFALSTNRPAILSTEERSAVASASASGKSPPAWIFTVSGGVRDLHTYVHPMPVATLQGFDNVLAA